METAFCSSDADGAWVWKDAYEACEAAQVMFLRKFGAAMRTRAGSAAAMLEMLTRLASRLPTQTRRSEESEHFQQFSTPLPLGFVAAEAAAITPSDLALEPSAGTGLLAIFAELARARLVLNEIADTRAGLLARLFRGLDVARHNAEQINDRLDPAIRPSLVLMNPPFSASPHMSVRFAEAAIRHVRSAFARLAEGGRLVAITGHNLVPDNPACRDSFIELQQKGRVVFTAPIAGRAYVRHGTNFETRLTVIDRVPAEDPRSFPSSPGTVADAAELLDQISRLVPPRPSVAAPSPVLAPAMFLTRAAPAARPKAASPQLALVTRPAPLPDAVELAYETCDWAPGETRFSASLYEGYALQSIRIPEARPHPTKMVQSAAMAAVAPPSPSYRPLLASLGILSDAQIESVIYAGEAHAGHLSGSYTVDETYDLVSAAPADATDAVRFRRGWFLGDGTGAGKGRQVLGRRIKAAVIREHWVEVRRLIASLKAGTVAPSAMLKKLAAYRRQNQLDLALQELGRIERTLFSVGATPGFRASQALRIGNFGTRPIDKRRLSIWISPRDLTQLVRIGLEHPDVRYEIVYGVSNNQRSWYDNSNACRLGYKPEDNSEPYAEAVLAAEPSNPDPIAERYQGGTLPAGEYTAKTPPA
jgi:hypothetical protein